MKKQGVIILENLLAFVLIMVIMGGIFLGVDQLKNVYSKYEHNKFKMQFLNFINLGKYKAFNDSNMYTIRFDEKSISLIDKEHVIVNRFNFPKNIKMVKFNGINNRTLTIQSNGLISRGATFTYSFDKKLNEITIAAVTGKVNYG